MSDRKIDFYVIRLVGDKTSGYVVDSPTGIKVAVDALQASVRRFDSDYLAKKFINKHKLDRKGCRCLILSNLQLIDDKVAGAVTMDKDVFYLENNDGWKMCYDVKQEGYFFKKCDAGFCCWETEGQIQKFIVAMEELGAKEMFIRKIRFKNEHET